MVSKKLRKNNKMLFALLIIAIIAGVIFAYKIVRRYQLNREFNFDQISPEGYFTDLETSIED